MKSGWHNGTVPNITEVSTEITTCKQPTTLEDQPEIALTATTYKINRVAIPERVRQGMSENRTVENPTQNKQLRVECALETKLNLLEMERAGLLQMLEDIGNELFCADDTGAWYAKADQTPWEHALAKKLNVLLGL